MDQKTEEQYKTILENKKIFIVEDDVFLGRLLLKKIGSVDLDVQLFPTGEDAVEALKTQVPAILLLDLLLPRMSGFEVLKWIREQETTKNLKVIVISNTDQATDRDRVKMLGAELVSKAMVTPDTILDYVAQMIEHGKIIYKE